ncbi:hypothetical protein K040078D81_44180 [Blautia hominis]|uniref:Uncharacterized protein n=1 Tax=Blautia hominis TaxID=2025493 RepID=A0ABQ0BFV1_9FIRM
MKSGGIFGACILLLFISNFELFNPDFFEEFLIITKAEEDK